MAYIKKVQAILILGLINTGMVARFKSSKVANYINAACHYLMPLDINAHTFRIWIYHR